MREVALRCTPLRDGYREPCPVYRRLLALPASILTEDRFDYTPTLYAVSDPHLSRRCDWPFEEAVAAITPKCFRLFRFFLSTKQTSVSDPKSGH
jgi:hypothetical protein